tara:strand:+ start:304 stop:513 length:210 start_codon:yes stop_codon:yes gene_type:complete
MKTVNPLEQLIKDNWESIKSCKTPMDQIILSINMVYQNELENCKPDEKVKITITEENGNIKIHGVCVKK